MIFAMRLRSNSCTSFRDRFPCTNSFQASSRFSSEMISLYACTNWIRQGKPPARRTILPVLQKIKDAYLLWHEYYKEIPKHHRHSFGTRTDILFVEIIEAVAGATFLSPGEKLPYVRLAIKKLDTVTIFLLMLWETNSLDDKKYIALSVKLTEIGNNLGGWNGQLTKQNSPQK